MLNSINNNCNEGRKNRNQNNATSTLSASDLLRSTDQIRLFSKIMASFREAISIQEKVTDWREKAMDGLGNRW